MTDETNAGTQVSGEDTAAVLNHAASGEKTYLEPKAEAPEVEEPKTEDLGEEDAAAKIDEDAPAEQPKRRLSAKERIDQLTWEKHELQRQYDSLLAGKAKADPAQEAQPTVSTGDGRPDPTAYEGGIYDPQYLEDVTDWKADQAVTRHLTQRDQRQAVVSKFSTFQEKAGELYPEGEPDGLQAFRKFPQVPPSVTEVILASDIGPKIAEHLGDNPREFQRLSGLSPALQAFELARIETRLSPPPVAAKPSTKTVTDAPEPPPQARGAGGQFKVAADTTDFAAFEKQYRIGG